MEKIRVCADPFPPYQYIDEDGQMKGSDYTLVMERLKEAGYNPEMKIAPWNEIYPEFENGEQDVLFQAQDSPERLEKFWLSKLLRYAKTEVVTANPDLLGLESHKELENYKVGVIADFANGPEIDSLPDSCKTEYKGAKEVLEAIYQGEVDCGVCDSGVKEFLISLMAHPPILYSIETLTYQRPLYVMFRNQKHRDDFDAAGTAS